MALSSTGSAARASVRRIGRSRFRDFGEVGDPGDSGTTGELPSRASATLRAPAFAILQAEAFATASVPSTPATPPAPESQTFSASRNAVRILNRAGARFLSVPLHELGAVAPIGGSVNHA